MKKQLLNIVLLLAIASAVNAQVSFAPAVNYGTGPSPYSGLTADFNNDGKTDIVTANYNGINVSALLGSGTGTFAAAANSAAGPGAYSVFAADFNGDGNMDLATANYNSYYVAVLLGSGTGTFAAAVNYVVGNNPYSVFSADFDNDGNMDLVAANSGSNYVSVLLGSGTGTFAAAVNYTVGNVPRSVFSADFNNDGNMDIVTANGANSASILFGSGTGTFAAAVNYAAGSGPHSVFSADFNGDGNMDLAVANATSNNVSVLLGSSTGTFAAAVNYGVGNTPRSVISTDFNNDGKMDLVTANQGTNNVSVLLGSGSGTFAVAVNYAVGFVPWSVFSADFNGDGKMDLATANASSTASVLLNTTTAAALYFDGSNDFVNIPNNSSFNFGTNDFTIETYAKTTSSTGNQVMIGKINGANNFWFGVSNGKANFSLTGGPDALGTSIIGDGNWHHLAAVRQSGVVSLYVDGVLEATQNNTGNATINGNLTLGNFSGGFNFAGSLDEVRIWNRGLCKGELLNNKNKELALTQSGLVAYYNFNQGLPAANNSAVTTLNDLSGNANNGTLNSFALSGTTSNWVAPGAVTSGSTAPTYTPVSASVSSQVNVLCNGGNTGSATVTTTGGTSPYTYLASTGATVSTLSNLTAGAYTYTVTDANTCKTIKTITITQPSALVTNTAVTNVLCNGGNTGSATVTTTGGTSPYTYLASTGATASTLSNVTAGAYTYTVTDNNGCVKTQALTITEPDILGAGLGIWAVSCNGLNNGQLSIIGIQGTAPYTYSWSTGATTSTISNLSPGVYTATVTDANGCVKISTKTITEPPPITVTITASNSSICSGSSSTLTASASGGLMGSIYTYSWVAGPTASVSVVSPTTTTVYTVNVADDNNCVNSSTINIVANVCTPAEALNFDGVNDYVDIPNNSNFNFGTNDFTIETWAKTTSTTGNHVMLGRINGGNNYWFGIGNGKAVFSMTGGTDAIGTSAISDNNWHHLAAVKQNGVISLYVDGIIEATQSNTGTATIAANITLGNFLGGYNFVGSLDEVRIWNNARTQCEINTYKNCEIPSNATGLVANYHFNQGNAAVNNVGVVSLTDATSNNITGTLANFTLNGTISNWVAPGGVVSGNTTPATAPTIAVNSGAICSGQSFTMMPTGATTFSYSTGSAVVTPTSNTTYTVTGTTSGCSGTAVSNVTVNALPTITVSNATVCAGQPITLNAISSGAAVNWYASPTSTNSLASGNSYSLVPTSTSTVYAQSTNYTTSTATVGLLDNSDGGAQQTSTNYNIFDALTNFTLTSVEVYPGAIGNAVIELRNNTGVLITSTTVAITSTVGPVTIPVNFAISTGTGYELAQGAGSVSLFRNNAGVSYPYTLPGVVSITNSAAGPSFYYFFYKWTVSTINGSCSSTKTPVTVTVNALPSISVNSGSICGGQSFTMMPMGADTYTYSGGSDVVMPTTDATYTVSGTVSATGCSNTAVSSVTVNPLPTVFSNPGNVHTCGDVSATFGISSAGTNTYQWYFEYTQLPNDSGLIDGSYTEINFDTDTMTIQQVLTGNYNNYYVYCEVTNQYGCKAYSTNDTIWANSTPTITVNSGTICAGQSFTMTPNGASTYSYSNGSSVVMPTVDVTYTVTGTDLNGCENTAVSTVTVNALPSIMATTNNTLLCTGETATLSVMGANTYTWSTTENTSDIVVSPTVQTTYTVDGTDANGCSNTTTITQDVSLCTGVASLTNDASVSVYPNPNKGTFVVELTSVSKVTVMNALGQVVISETFEVGKHHLYIQNETSGVYFVKVMTNNKQQIIKIIKE